MTDRRKSDTSANQESVLPARVYPSRAWCRLHVTASSFDRFITETCFYLPALLYGMTDGKSKRHISQNGEKQTPLLTACRFSFSRLVLAKCNC